MARLESTLVSAVFHNCTQKSRLKKSDIVAQTLYPKTIQKWTKVTSYKKEKENKNQKITFLMGVGTHCVLFN